MILLDYQGEGDGETGRSDTWHDGDVDPEDGVAGEAAWVWGAAEDSTDQWGAAGDSAGVAVSGSVPAGARGSDQERVGREREQPAREILHADGGGAEAACCGDDEVESDGGDYWGDSATDGGGVDGGWCGGSVVSGRWCRLRSWLRSVSGRRRVETEMEEEIQFHLEARAADLQTPP